MVANLRHCLFVCLFVCHPICIYHDLMPRYENTGKQSCKLLRSLKTAHWLPVKTKNSDKNVQMWKHYSAGFYCRTKKVYREKWRMIFSHLFGFSLISDWSMTVSKREEGGGRETDRQTQMPRQKCDKFCWIWDSGLCRIPPQTIDHLYMFISR